MELNGLEKAASAWCSASKGQDGPVTGRLAPVGKFYISRHSGGCDCDTCAILQALEDVGKWLLQGSTGIWALGIWQRWEAEKDCNLRYNLACKTLNFMKNFKN